MTEYYINPKYYQGYEVLIRNIGEEPVNLKGEEVTKKVTEIVGCCGKEKEVTYEEEIRGATQEDLKKVYEEETQSKKSKRKRLVWVRDVAKKTSEKSGKK